MKFEINVHLADLPELLAIGRTILHKLERLETMSQTNQERIDAANAAQQAALDAIQTDITTITAELQAAIPAPGMVPTQASLDVMQANVDRLSAVKAALDTLASPPPAP